jgi:hypothetical protein
MQVFVAWFADGTTSARKVHRHRITEGLDGIVPDAFRRDEFGGPDWGVTVAHPVNAGGYRWPVVCSSGGVDAISLGIPVGGDLGGGPARLAGRLLDGADIHASVVPPFGLIAVELDRVVIQQDWLGMARLFIANADGVTALSNRPSLLASILTDRTRPDVAGWASYALAGHFGGDRSPIDGVTLLHPGERVTATRGARGWSLRRDQRYAVGDVIAAGLAIRPDAALDHAADGLRRTVASLGELYDGEVTLGLSGGKDSRLVAAAFVATGRLPRLVTNNDSPDEAETATRLVEIVAGSRGLTTVHSVAPAGAPSVVLDVGLRERVVRLQHYYDFQFPSSYLARPVMPERLASAYRLPSVTGAAGELATAFWYPRANVEDDAAVEQATLAHLLAALPHRAAAPWALDLERRRVRDLLADAADVGLAGAARTDYVYLMERMRRWSSAAYAVGMVAPFLAPDVVAATFALTAEQKRGRRMHDGLIERFVPEWSAVPFVKNGTGPSSVVRVWDGDGASVLSDLAGCAAPVGLAGLLRTDAILRAVADCEHGTPNPAQHRTLTQFAALAVASQSLAPAGVTIPRPRDPARVGSRLAPVRKLARRIAARA